MVARLASLREKRVGRCRASAVRWRRGKCSAPACRRQLAAPMRIVAPARNMGERVLYMRSASFDFAELNVFVVGKNKLVVLMAYVPRWLAAASYKRRRRGMARRPPKPASGILVSRPGAWRYQCTYRRHHRASRSAKPFSSTRAARKI